MKMASQSLYLLANLQAAHRVLFCWSVNMC